MEAPVIGAGCAKKFGNPESIRQLARTLRDTGQGLDQLVAEAGRTAGDLVPGNWRGQAATGFQTRSGEQQKATAQAAALARTVAEAALVLATALESCWKQFDEAQTLALCNGLDILGNCWVQTMPYGNQAAARVADGILQAAMREADGARMLFRSAVLTAEGDIAAIVRPLIGPLAAATMGLGGPGRGGGGGRPGGGPRPKPSVKEFFDAGRQGEPIVVPRPEPKLGDYRRSQISFGKKVEPESARVGKIIHRMLAEGDRPYEGQKLAGTDWEVMGVERKFGDDRQLDFVLVNHEKQPGQVKVYDYFTGPDEPLAHNIKGWGYKNTPEIKALIDKGYEYEYIPVYTWKVN
jgi:uncharacterized protein YukE